MVARFLRNLLLAQLLFVLLVAGLTYQLDSHASAWVALATGLVAIILLRLLITAQNFVLAWHFASPKPAYAKLNLWQKLRLFCSEFYATLISSSWLMWRRTFSARPTDNSDSADLPVLLIHGYGCNSGYWTYLSRQLSREGISHFALDLEPILGSIDDYIPLVAAKVEQICTQTGKEQIIIVAHSMGGLVTRNYLRAHGSAHIAHVITLGTPHNGTGLANFGPGKNSQQMRWRKTAGSSAWLRALADSESAATRSLFTSIYSHHDNIIAPQTSSELEGAKNIALYGIGHVALALHPQVQQLVIDEIHLVSGQSTATAQALEATLAAKA